MLRVPGKPNVTGTAFGPQFIVAVEQFTEPRRRIVHDALARRMLPPATRLAIAACAWNVVRNQIVTWSERRFPGLWGSLLCRKRYGDDQYVEARSRGIGHVVLLGAGLDDRAYRGLTTPPPQTFELDLPDNSEYKRRRLVSIFSRVPPHARLIAVDFESADLSTCLGANGFRDDLPSLFIWEAVTQYLTETAVRRTLTALSRSAAGSRLIFTYVRRDFLDGTNLYQLPGLYAQFVGKQRLWHFGLDPSEVNALLQEYGWAEREQVGATEYRQRYLEPLGRQLGVTDVERFVLAERTSA
ncbi:MAG: SAM-dependent methyltransferase [Chloroflexi bacterium]|nr:SAM-dependent methyltransferase [Chloroflexota bacterium]